MIATHQIKYLKRHEIDDAKWDDVIHSSPNGLLYVTTFFLDGVCTKWDALVCGNYDFIMPLPQRKKLGIAYLYQPIGMAQGGIFSKEIVSEEIEKLFIETVLSKFKYGTINFNETSGLNKVEGCKINNHNNFILHLNATYEEIFNNYNEDGKKNVRRAKNKPQQLAFHSTAQNALELYLLQYASRITKKKLVKEFEQFATFLEKLVAKGMAFNACVVDDKDEMLASAVFGTYRNRLYYLFGAPSPKGRQYKSTHFLLDAIIEKYSSSDFLLDFEGSEIPSVATFYKKFGPINKPYKTIHFNQLHPVVKLFKK